MHGRQFAFKSPYSCEVQIRANDAEQKCSLAAPHVQCEARVQQVSHQHKAMLLAAGLAAEHTSSTAKLLLSFGLFTI